MSFTVEEFRDLVRLLEERPEWRAEIRRLVLSDALLSLPEQVAELRVRSDQQFQELREAFLRLTEQVKALAEAQKRTEARVGELAEAQKRTEARLETLVEQVTELTGVVRTLVDDVGDLKGRSLENEYRTKVFAYFSRIVRRPKMLSPEELTTLLDDAIDAGVLSEEQAREISLADVIVRGKHPQDRTEVYLVAEVSWGVGSQDVDRAVRRALLLTQTGVSAIPVVAGRRITAEAAQLAQTEQVWQLTDGYAVPPTPTAEPS